MAREMRLLHVINTLDPEFGGPVEAVRQFSTALAKDHSIEVLCLDECGPSQDWPVPIHSVPGAKTKYRFNPSLIPWLKNNARRFDAVLGHGIWHYHTVGTWLGLRGTGVPYVILPHGMLNPWFKNAHPLKHLKKAAFWHTFVHRSLQNAAAVLFLCQEEQRLASYTFAMKLRGEAITPLGIEEPPSTPIAAATFLSTFPRLRGKRLFLFLGRIARVKNCDSLLRAFAALCGNNNDCHLLMSGPDFEGWKGQLVRLSEELRIADRITWTGPLYGDLKWGAIRASELLVLPSHCETFPVAVLEALACRRAVLVSDGVGIYREVADGNAGLVCRDDVDSIASSLRTWWSLSPEQRTSFGEGAYELYRARYEIRTASARQVDVIRGCMESSRRVINP
jgi:glycosyltransferase involved in cell wall biosynthesis